MKRIILLLSLSVFLIGTSSSGISQEFESLSTLEIKTNIEQVLTVLDQSYVYPEVAKVMRGYAERQFATGLYDQSHSLQALITRLQLDLREASKDEHISLHLAIGVADRKDHTGPISESNKHVQTEVITGEESIGYLKFNLFSPKVVPKERIATVMKELSSTDSLIIDLRDNEGGDPNLVAFLSSYFVKANTPLWSVLDRQGETIIEVFSQQQNSKYQGGVCLLTSEKTYSGAEAFAYTLKHLGRACIIGETTRGGAHLVKMQQVNDELDIRIPVARAFNPITKSNWERVGVIPTWEVDSLKAKATAIDYLQRVGE